MKPISHPSDIKCKEQISRIQFISGPSDHLSDILRGLSDAYPIWSAGPGREAWPHLPTHHLRQSQLATSSLIATTAAETAFNQALSAFLRVSPLAKSRLLLRQGPSVALALEESPLGRWVAAGTTEEDKRVSVDAVRSAADDVAREVFSSVLNGSQMVNFTMATPRGDDALFFVKSSRSSAPDAAQLRRLGAGRVNLTLHEVQGETAGGKMLDAKVHLNGATVTIRYGAPSSQAERSRLLRHAGRVAARRAWARERALLRDGRPGSRSWTSQEASRLLTGGLVPGYAVIQVRASDPFPELALDMDNLRIVSQEDLDERSP